MQLAGGVQHIRSNEKAFAADKSDGSVVAWGDPEAQAQLDGVAQSVVKNYGWGSATAVLKTDGSVITWGSFLDGGDCSAVQGQLTSDVQHICGNSSAFAALKTDGSVVAWGVREFGGDCSSVQEHLRSDVHFIRPSELAFLATKSLCRATL